jgi:hypothetical protein
VKRLSDFTHREITFQLAADEQTDLPDDMSPRCQFRVDTIVLRYLNGSLSSVRLFGRRIRKDGELHKTLGGCWYRSAQTNNLWPPSDAPEIALMAVIEAGARVTKAVEPSGQGEGRT